MRNAFFVDLRRAVFSMRFVLSVGLGLLMLYQPAYPFGFYDGVHFPGSTLCNALMDTMGLGSYVLFACVLCALPYGDVHAWEVDSGAYPYILSRTGTRPYILSKIASAAASGALVTSLPVLIFCLVQAFAFSPAPPTGEEWADAAFQTGAFFLHGGSWALCALALSAWFPSPLAALAAPFCIARFLWIFSAYTGIHGLSATYTVNITSTIRYSLPQAALHQSCFALPFIVIFILGVNRKKC